MPRFWHNNRTQPKHKWKTWKLHFQLSDYTMPCVWRGNWASSKNAVLNIWILTFLQSDSFTLFFWRRNWTQHPTRNFERMEIAFAALRFYHFVRLAPQLDTTPEPYVFGTLWNLFSDFQTLPRCVSDTATWHNTQNTILSIWKLHVHPLYSTLPCFWRRNRAQYPNRNFEHVKFAFPTTRRKSMWSWSVRNDQGQVQGQLQMQVRWQTRVDWQARVCW